jgi:predicted porin
MKKSLVALAALAVAGVASAQSSVTLFGIVDAGVSYYDTKVDTPTGTVKRSQTAQSNSGYNSSRLGFRGTEDLGGGLAASFWLEAALGNDNGTMGGNINSVSGPANTGFTPGIFNRRSTVSLSGGFGEVRIGRDYTPTFWNDTVFDPFGTNGVGTNIVNSAHSMVLGFTNPALFGAPAVLVGGAVTGLSDANTVRASNTVGYFLPPNLGGFYGQVQYGFDENTRTSGFEASSAGRYFGGRFGYANGPLDVALAYGEADVFWTAPNTVSAKTLNLGASYDFGVVKLFGDVSRVKNDADVAMFIPPLGGAALSSVNLNGFLLGATVPVGPGLIRVAYSQVKADMNGNDPLSRKFAVGYVHNLSKRTALYATYAHISNKDGGNATTGGTPNFGAVAGSIPGSANGYDIGIRHAF